MPSERFVSDPLKPRLAVRAPETMTSPPKTARLPVLSSLDLRLPETKKFASVPGKVGDPTRSTLPRRSSAVTLVAPIVSTFPVFVLTKNLVNFAKDHYLQLTLLALRLMQNLHHHHSAGLHRRSGRLD